MNNRTIKEINSLDRQKIVADPRKAEKLISSLFYELINSRPTSVYLEIAFLSARVIRKKNIEPRCMGINRDGDECWHIPLTWVNVKLLQNLKDE